MTAQPMVIACPCGGHRLSLPADKLPVGGRAAFTCPACGVRRTCVRTERGVVVDDQSAPDASSGPLTQPAPSPQATPQPEQTSEAPPAKQAPPLPAGDLPPPSPAPPAARIALAAVAEADWAAALGHTLGPDWHVLFPGTAKQALADFLALAPDVVLLDDGEAARTVQAAADALPGRSREALTLLALLPCPDADAMAAFAHSADAVLDERNPDAKVERLREALKRCAAQPTLLAGERG
ncbi:hypothetical protein [Desulfovibrio sp. TomC]|uniref:hypothetical protein n=1 Tax=Desulfovibrio sp. TomC TaxID=1562888 RepID=UPI0005756530|nr:hypothetical protein [Desulfovibrio sp. TomC]KHK02562.1 hypothetical protein NY78_1919 [Desulfovibrio sp. TomC]